MEVYVFFSTICHGRASVSQSFHLGFNVINNFALVHLKGKIHSKYELLVRPRSTFILTEKVLYFCLKIIIHLHFSCRRFSKFGELIPGFLGY